jgi:hypothetical protein
MCYLGGSDVVWAEWGRARKPISTHQLAKLLRRFHVSPHTIRVGDETPRGYYLADFAEAFSRYLPEPPRLRVRQCNMNAGLPMKTAKSTCVSKVQHALTLLHSENASFSSCVAVLHSGNPRRGFRTLTKRQRHSTCARSTRIAPFADCTRSHSNPNAKQARPRIIT